ncbi:T7SS effector LXG polymorphic toxin [Bacillus inaquosorum]|uniref:ribonuclease YeeF family protein n=1 Tax=Bacillus inaquosorum TaxID=483913 RepID=UPI00227DDF1F|nr:T7SS effector LXG polymorphic toxin [Bacillus inaquosorum]MCY7974594.1 T7SS effector LXG polymorphic toxin [Bacillus inaquosorum]MCY8147114.1 T7SS effector LXG polymorphic toxin [Bacillus inaquosorum]MCY8796669.1 T7SS effector LXG polymorphic toxin [Bacillus inaquosorum]MCY8852042.1 T7SS effector LXG polymorphic toxin [Bacillus inaquosorum]MCY9063843.1 T7SS effector LXG polymorphic toxin [Bacillus inaquosorum]
MKTLDVHALHEGIQHTIEKLDKQKQQLEKLEKSVEHLAGMKDALKGKGGDAIRTFYEECHKPFLLFFGMFIDEYKKVLKQTQHGISSVESDSHGMIAEDFLSHDARHGVKHAREVTEQLTDAVNRQTSAIDHIVSLPTVNDSFFRMETEQAERLITDTLHKLFQFDGQQTQALETAKSDFQTMKKYIDQLENMYTGPKIEITGYKSGSILKSQEEENINQTFGAINPQMKQPDDSPMEMMLKKLEKHKQSNVDTVMKDGKQQKIEREIHADDSNVTVLQKEAAAHPKVYGDIRVINDKLYNHKGLKKIDTIEVIDELTRDTASIDYVGGKYYVYENGQIVREFYAGGKKRLEEVSYIPEDKVGGAKSLDSFLAGTQYEFIEWVSPQGAIKKLAVRGGKRVVTDVAKHVAEKDIKGDVKKKTSKGSVNSKWWHPGYVDNLSSSQTVIGIKNSPKGLSTLGSSTRQNALDAGKGWVGKGAEKMYDKAGNFLGYKSVDKMRAFRLQYKPKEKMWRANFTENEITVVGSKTELRNVHVDILD